ncbi:hypothetical protein AURDEDRAFT_171530 [Auricularia subglabra TFB-10046 SS5]|nr:hypothetical protein AURDEDRAFT_171530 [Auricularia subglabra TFB-10046 SS5]
MTVPLATPRRLSQDRAMRHPWPYPEHISGLALMPVLSVHALVVQPDYWPQFNFPGIRGMLSEAD